MKCYLFSAIGLLVGVLGLWSSQDAIDHLAVDERLAASLMAGANEYVMVGTKNGCNEGCVGKTVGVCTAVNGYTAGGTTTPGVPDPNKLTDCTTCGGNKCGQWYSGYKAEP